MKNIYLHILLLFVWLPCLSQVNIDSSYSLVQLEDFLEQARENQSHQELADTYFLLADYEESINSDFQKSFEYYTRSLDYYKIGNNIEQIHKIKKRIAERYLISDLYTEAINIYEELLNYYRGDEHLRERTYLFSDLSKVYRKQGDLEKEYFYLNKSLELNKVLQDTLLEVEFLFDKIQNYETLSELDSAIVLSFTAFRLSKQIEHRENISLSLFHIADLNRKKRRFKRAIKYFKQSENYLSSKPYNESRLNLYRELSKCYHQLNQYDTAYVYSVLYATLNDSILNQGRQESMNNLTIKYETRETKNEIKLLEQEKKYSEQTNKQQRRALYVLTGGLVLVLLLMYYFIRFYSQKIKAGNIINLQKEEINQRKIRELEDEMKINSMQSMIEGQEIERERIAKDLHDSLGGMLSSIKLQFESAKYKDKAITKSKDYNRATNMLDNAVNEVRNISRNLQPSSLKELGLVPAIKDLINRFESDIYPDIDLQCYNIPKHLDKMISLSIYRIIQEMLHNTIKHANASEILIQINREGDELVIHFEDDGVGFDINNLRKRGMGLENIESRVNYLKGTLSIDSEIGKGSSFVIHVKY